MSTSLAIQKTITPPPTKTEVIEALVQLRFQEWQKKDDEAKAEITKLEKAIKKEAFFIAKKKSVEDANIRISTYAQGRVEVEFTVFPADIKSDFVRYKKLRDSLRCFDGKEERRIVQSGLNGAKEKRDLLSNPETRKRLVALGTQIGIL